MPTIHVCPLDRLDDEVRRLAPSALVTLLAPNGTVPARPATIAPDRHLQRLFHDITWPRDDLIAPSVADIDALLAFAHAWDRARPMLVHCFAGISRSTAAAYIMACALHPGVDESDLADALRTASPTATPNALMIEIADAVLAREGRMTAAIEAIGMGAFASTGSPFRLVVPGPPRTDNPLI